jgi:beta-lactamase superfamily II metal-dependent hydrolase
MLLTIWDVEHGACAMLTHRNDGALGRLAMIDSGHAADWRPSTHIRHGLGRARLDYLFITNADQDHMSDLDGLWDHDIHVATLTRNPHPSPVVLKQIKLNGGPLSNDIERFIDIHGSYNQPVTEPFNDHMGGIRKRTFFNKYPDFEDTNNLSLALFIEYNGFKILFPGDLEVDGWLALLDNDDFRAELEGVSILVASHHGRENGYCPEVFDYCRPQAVIMSDKAIQHSTQLMTQSYRYQVQKNYPDGVLVATTGKRRHVLTTRRDGHIEFTVYADGSFMIETEYAG